MKCIIVDDDLNCIKALAGIIKDYLPKIEIVGTAANIKEAVKLINANHLDIVFLDVEIQTETGFDLFKYISAPNFEVIFTTAHEKYALKAIKSSCFDFLLKPIEIQELVNTINRLEMQKGAAADIGKRTNVLLDNLSSHSKKVEKLAIPTKDGMMFINVKDIMYLEGDAKYTTLHLYNKERYVSSKNIGEFEELLDAETFFRCHRSWIINLNSIVKYLKNDNRVLLSDDTLIDVSTRKKDEFLKLFNRI
ncbi:MAG: response regulator transcription factor [Bacteroidia bacterium]|nr:response regulator transcription factor [Bacteroidia bacterium]